MENADNTPLHLRIPFVDYKYTSDDSYLETLETTPHPWLMKSHYPASIFQSQIETGHCKFIVILRNIKDVLASYYHFYQANAVFGFFTGSFDEFFELFRKKRLCYGDWLDHSVGWWKYRDNKNVLFLTYEAMKKDVVAEIKKIAIFCGQSLTSEEIDFIVKKTEFNKMKKDPMAHYTLSMTPDSHDSSISPLLRKGEVGDWKNYFNEEMNEFIDEHYISPLKAEGVQLDYNL